MVKLTQDQVEGLINEHIELGEQIKALKKRDDEIKAKYTHWLDNVGAAKVQADTFTATKSKRKGAVDLKKIQIAYKIPDYELETYRKDGSEFWTVKKK